MVTQSPAYLGLRTRDPLSTQRGLAPAAQKRAALVPPTRLSNTQQASSYFNCLTDNNYKKKKKKKIKSCPGGRLVKAYIRSRDALYNADFNRTIFWHGYVQL